MNRVPPSYIELSREIGLLLLKHPSSLVAIAGKTWAGKTTLARYLSWTFQISVLETDMFRHQVEGHREHDTNCIRDALEFKKKMEKPVVIEGCLVRSILQKAGIIEDYLVYVEAQRPKTTDSLSSEPYFYENTLRHSVDPSLFGNDKCDMDAKESANFVVSLHYDEEGHMLVHTSQHFGKL